MTKSLSTARRINTILALAVVFLLVLATNRIDQYHFKTAQKNMNEVFDDRVLVQDYIFAISRELQNRQLELYGATPEVKNPSSEKNENVSQILSRFEETKLTPAEDNLLKNFRKDFNALEALDEQSKAATDLQLHKRKSDQLDALQQNLLELSEIQVRESRRLTRESQKSLDVSNLLANLEIFFLIVIGIILQVLIFYKSKKLAKQSAA